MAELHDLRPAPGSRSPKKRRGRGPGSGLGKRSGRGQKGQKSRSGNSIPAGFEGGQMPLQRRLPKGGFKPRRRITYQVVNVGRLERFEGTDVTPEHLYVQGLVRSPGKPVKLLAKGDIGRSLRVSVHAASAAAEAKIEAAGGSVTRIKR